MHLITILNMFFLVVTCARNLVEISLKKHSRIRIQEIKVISNCVYNLSAVYAGGRKLIFMSDQIDTDVSAYLIRNMDQGLKIISSTANVSQNIGFFILFQDSRELSYLNILGRIPPNNVMQFVIVFDFQDRIDLRHIQKVLEEFWVYQIIDVIALIPYKISNNIRVYTYYPYSSTRCGETGPPVLINIWNSQNRAFMNKMNLFDKSKKVFNLHGCLLRCVGINRPPESTIIQLVDNTWQLTGTGNRVFKFIESHMNFSSQISLYQKVDPRKNFKVKNTSNPVATARFDIAFGKFIRLLDTEPSADFTNDNVVDCFTWAVPRGIGRQPSIWTKYIIEFSVLTWCMILLVIFISSVIIRCMVSRAQLKHSEWNSFHFILFFTFSTFIGATIRLKSNSSLLRMFVAQWLFFSMVVTSAYTAFMGSLMTIPQTEPEVNKQSDLLNTTLKLVGRQEMFYVLNESAANNEEFREIIKRFFVLPPIDFDVIINRMIEQRDIAVFTSKRELIYYAQKRRMDLSKEQEIHIFSECVLKSYASAFMLKRGSPFQHPIHGIIMRLFETGIYSHWDNDNIRDEIYHNIIFSKETVLVLKELYGAFVVLIAGLGISSLVFFLELLVKIIADEQK